jgi:monofunctional biosynthetic peptidoglycan transglycosylase
MWRKWVRVFLVLKLRAKIFWKECKKYSRTEAAMIIACLPNPKIYTVKPVSRHVSWKHQWIMRQMSNIEDDVDVQAVIK